MELKKMQRYIFSLLFILIGFGSVFSQEKPTIAIIPFNAMGVSESEAKTASDLLESAIIKTDQFKIIEQNQVDDTIKAQTFSLTGNTDEDYARHIGKLLPADQIIFGSFSNIGSEFILNARIIYIESGQIIESEKISFATIEELSESIEWLANKLIENNIETLKISLDNSESKNTNLKHDSYAKYIYQLSIGPSHSFYFKKIQTVIDSMDKGSLSRIPISMDLLFGNKMSESTAWTVSLNGGIDSLTDSSDSFQIFTILFSIGVQYIPFQKGLTFGLNVGGSLLAPNTTLDYKGGIGFGSSISIDVGYFFEQFKFTNAGIVPGLGIKYIHSEIFRGSVDLISGYINLGIR